MEEIEIYPSIARCPWLRYRLCHDQ